MRLAEVIELPKKKGLLRKLKDAKPDRVKIETTDRASVKVSVE